MKQLMNGPQPSPLLSAAEARWSAVTERDSGRDGEFVYGVITTGVYCKPSCPARRPRRENVRFYAGPEQAERDGLRACRRCHPRELGFEQRRLTQVCRFIEQHLEEPITLAALAREIGLSPFHLQRRFKAMMGMTPREYADACRLRLLKGRLRRGHSVTRAMNDAGYNSASRLYSRTARLGMTPGVYRRGAPVVIRYAVVQTALGAVLLAATGKGVCAIQFVDAEQAVEDGLRHEFPQATLIEDRAALAQWTGAVRQHLAGAQRDLALPLDIRATAFQQRVWRILRDIPYAQTRTYTEVARAVGNPKAARAVASACAANPVALAIPCHRVVRSDGGPGGYRWGLARKEKLLRDEADRCQGDERFPQAAKGGRAGC